MQRFDAAVITGKTERTPEGYLRARAIVTRAGVFNYRNADGTPRRELRLPEHIFAEDSLATLKQIPITLGHPPEWVDKDNAAVYMKGMTGETVEHDEQNILCSLTITHADAIRAIESGHQRQLSLGYDLTLVPEKGVYNGDEYDAIQTGIKYNHLAIVNRARAGGVATLRMDQAEMIEDIPSFNKGSRMTIHIDGIDHEVSEPVAAHIVSVVKRAEDAEGKVTALETDLAAAKANVDQAEAEKVKNADEAEKALSAVKAELDNAKGRIDGLEAELAKAKNADTAAVIEAGVQARLALLSVAQKAVDGETFDAIKGKTSREIMVAVIGKNSDGFSDEGKSDEYIIGRFDSITSAVTTEKGADKRALDNADGCFGKGKGGMMDQDTDSCAAAKARQDASMTGAWKKEKTPKKEGC